MNFDPRLVRRVISVEQWAEIRRLHRSEGVPIKEIARRLGVARNTVRRRWPQTRRRSTHDRRRARWSMLSNRRSGRCCGSIRRCRRR
ncbi:helix-turn-helix domain-containing protein [Gordonia rubripertincta]|uniref:helix-turn-helix domain-containing protein n=1 Tax=Gordonia rubripertincta TaxID=36822 RepID=UPI0028C5059F|nr:helix-turn-helix domain-containing protein [Gordonia rubripertincta]